MKNRNFKLFIILSAALLVLSGCSKDGDAAYKAGVNALTVQEYDVAIEKLQEAYEAAQVDDDGGDQIGDLGAVQALVHVGAARRDVLDEERAEDGSRIPVQAFWDIKFRRTYKSHACCSLCYGK